MRDATREESLRAIEVMIELRLRKAGKQPPTDTWIKETALRTYEETQAAGDKVQILGESELTPPEGA